MRNTILAVLAAGLFVVVGSEASAQSGSGYSRPSSRPFDNVVSRPTVSPYLNLVNQNAGGPGSVAGFNGNTARYQNLVRPQLQQRQQFSQTQNQLRGLQNQVQEIRSTAIGGISNTTGMGFQGQGFATGHPALFQYYSRYYPALGGRR